MVVIDIIIATHIENMIHITNTEEDHITEDNKLIKIQIIKTRIIFIT